MPAERRSVPLTTAEGTPRPFSLAPSDLSWPCPTCSPVAMRGCSSAIWARPAPGAQTPCLLGTLLEPVALLAPWFVFVIAESSQVAHRDQCLPGRMAAVPRGRSWQRKPKSLPSSRSAVRAGSVPMAPGLWGVVKVLALSQHQLSLPSCPHLRGPWTGPCWAGLTPRGAEATCVPCL